MKTCQTCSKELNDNIPHWTTRHKDNSETYTCEFCFKDEKIKQYLENGELGSQILMDATSCAFYVLEAKNGLDGLRQEYQTYYNKHMPTLLKINRDYKKIEEAGRELELAWWFPTLQEYYNSHGERGHSAQGDEYKALLWGCAGRVMLTLQDNDPNGKGKYNGAWVTLIFDEDSPEPRGGIQGLAATKDEALGLIKAAMKEQPKMEPDKDVTLAGL